MVGIRHQNPVRLSQWLLDDSSHHWNSWTKRQNLGQNQIEHGNTNLHSIRAASFMWLSQTSLAVAVSIWSDLLEISASMMSPNSPFCWLRMANQEICVCVCENGTQKIPWPYQLASKTNYFLLVMSPLISWYIGIEVTITILHPGVRFYHSWRMWFIRDIHEVHDCRYPAKGLRS